MKIALNGATTMKADLRTDIVSAAEAGFDGIEIWAPKLRRFLEVSPASELRELIASHGLEAVSINSIERISFRDSDGHRALLDECRNLSRIAADIGCHCIVVVPSPLPDGISRDEIILESSHALRRMAEVARDSDVRLAFEFLGQPDCSVKTLDLANEIVEKVGAPDVGLVIDSFHFYAGGSRLDSIREIDPKRICVFHINDAEDRPRSELEDRHRLLPGLGILPLGDIIASLEAIGYDGYASVEIFRPEYWELDAGELAREAWRVTARQLGAADR
jgi:2-keto-myo-inositol isomerase